MNPRKKPYPPLPPPLPPPALPALLPPAEPPPPRVAEADEELSSSGSHADDISDDLEKEGIQ